MKFCTNCGTQCQDESVFCQNCGSSFQSVNYTQFAPAQQVVSEKAESRVVKKINVFAFIYNLLATLYGFVTALSFAFAAFYVGIYKVYYHLNDSAVIIGLILSFGMLALGIVCFIFGLKQKESIAYKFAGISRFVAGIAAVILSLVLTTV